MIETRPVQTTITKPEIRKVLCNKCGKVIFDITDDNALDAEYVHTEKAWEYGSKYDCEVHRFDLCEECYDKIRAEFMIPVEVEDTLAYCDYGKDTID